MANPDFVQLPKPMHDQLAIPYNFILDDLVQRLSKGVLAQDSNDQRSFRLRKRLRRPFDKLGQMIKERRLEIVFLEGLAAKRRRERAQENDEQNQPATTGPAANIPGICRRGNSPARRHWRPGNSPLRHRIEGGPERGET